jgi:DNA polymerase III epsilon subunit-like protein
MKYGARIVSTGLGVPSRRITNDDMSKIVDTNDEWISSRTGIKERKFLDTENEIPEYNLQYLRYFLDFDIEAKAHDAIGDVLVLEKLFQNLYNRMMEIYKDENIVIEKMIEISGKPLLLRLFNYGKHKGKKIEEVLSYDRNYLEWMLEQKLNEQYYDEDWIYTLKYHLKIN